MEKLSLVGIAALTAAAAVSVWAMLQSADATSNIDAGTLLFIAWAVSPYACVLFAGRLIERYTRLFQRSLVFCVVSLLMLAFTLVTYPGISNDPSSTAALAFVVVPIYLYVGSFILIAIGLGVAWLFARGRTV